MTGAKVRKAIPSNGFMRGMGKHEFTASSDRTLWPTDRVLGAFREFVANSTFRLSGYSGVDGGAIGV